MSNPVIISAVRTAGGKFGGGLMKLTGPELGTIAIKAAIERAGIKGEDVDEVILGTGWQAGVGANPARIAMYHAGIPCSVPAFTVNIRCGSGLRTMMLAADKIRLGDANVVVAGGMESASNVPYILPKARWGFRMGEQKALDVLHKDGFLCPIAGKLMGESCEDIAAEYHITRQEQDEFALASHQKAAAASKAGLFKDEIVPVVLKDRKKGEIVIDTDEIFRADTSLEQLAKLPTIFKKDGGGQWAVQGPIMIEAAQKIGADFGRVTMALCWGDSWTNMIQPFWALPVLAICDLDVRDIMGYCFMIALFVGIVCSLGFLFL